MGRNRFPHLTNSGFFTSSLISWRLSTCSTDTLEQALRAGVSASLSVALALPNLGFKGLPFQANAWGRGLSLVQ